MLLWLWARRKLKFMQHHIIIGLSCIWSVIVSCMSIQLKRNVAVPYSIACIAQLAVLPPPRVLDLAVAGWLWVTSMSYDTPHTPPLWHSRRRAATKFAVARTAKCCLLVSSMLFIGPLSGGRCQRGVTLHHHRLSRVHRYSNVLQRRLCLHTNMRQRLEKVKCV